MAASSNSRAGTPPAGSPPGGRVGTPLATRGTAPRHKDADPITDPVTGLTSAPGPESSGAVIQRSLSALRKHLGMDVAFVGRFGDGRRRFEYVDAGESFHPIQVGGSDPLEDSYCARVVDGRIPGLIADASDVPAVADLPATHDLPVGAHLSVPLRRESGDVLGTLCCFSREPDPTLRDRDLQVVRMFADLVTGHLESLLEHESGIREIADRVSEVVARGGPTMAMQPIVHLPSGAVYGYEALSRFLGGPWTPEQWYDEAALVGLGPALEASAIGSALRVLPQLPAGCVLSVNVSAAALCEDQTLTLVTGPAAPRLVVELTEHTRLDGHPGLEHRLVEVRKAGARIAVDDAGAGYAGLEHILRLDPDVLKLDRRLVLGIAEHPGRQAMAEAMVGFARRMGATLVAEGVETDAELATLRALGVEYAQGYLLGRPTMDYTKLT